MAAAIIGWFKPFKTFKLFKRLIVRRRNCQSVMIDLATDFDFFKLKIAEASGKT
jgi:hypothetical protein